MKRIRNVGHSSDREQVKREPGDGLRGPSEIGLQQRRINNLQNSLDEEVFLYLT
jgi:hypothetical protein